MFGLFAHFESRAPNVCSLQGIFFFVERRASPYFGALSLSILQGEDLRLTELSIHLYHLRDLVDYPDG